MAFNINAQVILSGPKNITAVTKQIKTQLKGITVPVNISIDKKISKNLGRFNKGVKDLTGSLQRLSVASRNADADIRRLSASLSTLSTSGRDIGRSMDAVTGATRKSAAAMKEAGTELQQFGKDAALAIRRFTAFTVATGVVFGFVRAIQQATSSALDYERQIVKVVQVTGANARKIAQLKKTVDDLSVSLGVDANELAELSRIFAQTGQTIDQVRASIRSVARSSLAPSFGTMKSTAEGLIAAMAQFNISASKSEQVLGALNAVSKRFAVEAEDLISVVRRAGGVFSTAAGQMRDPQDSLNELIGLFTAVRSTTRESADTIATGLRTIFTRIQRRGTIDFLKQFNVELVTAKGNFIGIFPAFAQLQKGLSALIRSGDAVSLSAVTEELGGIRQVGKLIPAIVNFNKALAATEIAAQGAARGLGKDVGLALQPLGKQFEQVAARFNTLIRTISESKTFQNLAKVAISTANAFLSVAEALTPLIPLITTLTTIKLTKGFFEFSRGFVGGLRKGGGAGGVGTNLGETISGGGGGKPRDSVADKRFIDAIMANSRVLRANTVALNTVNASLRSVDNKMVLLGQTIMNEVRSLVAALRAGGGGFRPPKFATGGYVKGPSHAQGGVMAELEGGEYVIPKGLAKGTVDPRDIMRGRARTAVAPTLGPRRAKAMERLKRIRGKLPKRTITAKKSGLGKDIDLLEILGLDPDNNNVLEVGGAFLRTNDGRPVVKRQRFKLGVGDFKFATGKKTKVGKIGQLAQQNLKSGFGLTGSRSQVPVDIFSGTLQQEVETKFEKEFKTFTQALAKKTIGTITGSFSSTNFQAGLKKANFEQTVGNIFEAAIAGSAGKFGAGRESANAPFDFPRGLGSTVASKFRSLNAVPNAPTDAKRTFGPDALGSIISKARNFLKQAFEREALVSELAIAQATGKGILGKLSGYRKVEDLHELVGFSPGTKTRDVAPTARRLGFRFAKSSKRETVYFDPELPGGGPDWQRINIRGAGDNKLLDGSFELVPLERKKGGSIPIDWSPRGTDTVPAMLTPGEFVINRKSAQKIGYSKLGEMNRMARGGMVRPNYLASGGGSTPVVPPPGSPTTTSDPTSTLIEKLGALSVVVAGVTTSFAGLDITSMTSVLNAAAGLAFSFQQLAFFAPEASKALFGGIKNIFGGTTIGSSFGGVSSALEAATEAFHMSGRTHRIPTVRGFGGEIKAVGAGLKAFTESIGGVTGYFKGLPGLLTALIATPIVNASINAGLGKIEEIAPGIQGRRGVSAKKAATVEALGGAVKGGLTGAAIGSFIPIVGPLIGAAIGAVGGAISSGVSAFFDQELFNTFEEIKRAGDALADTLAKVNRTQGKLDERTQRTFNQQTEAFSLSILQSFETFDKTMSLIGGFDEFLGFEGSGRKQVEEFVSTIKNSREAIAKASQGIGTNINALFPKALGSGASDIVARIANVQDPLMRQAVRGRITGGPATQRGWFGADPAGLSDYTVDQRAGEVGERRSLFVEGVAGARGSGALAFQEISQLLREAQARDLAASGTGLPLNRARGDLIEQRDQKAFLDFTKLAGDQLDQFKKMDDLGLGEGQTEGLVIGLKKIAKNLDLTSLSTANLEQGLQKTYEQTLIAITGERNFTQAKKVATQAQKNQAREAERLLSTILGDAAARDKANAIQIQAIELQRQAALGVRFFSLELKRLNETLQVITEGLNRTTSDAVADVDVLLGGRTKFRAAKPIVGPGGLNESQMRFLEAGGPRATNLRGLASFQKRLPGILEATIREARTKRASGEDINDPILTAMFRKRAQAAVPGAPKAAIDQVAASLSGVDRQGDNTADALERWSDKLKLSAGDLDTLSPLAKQAKEASTKAFRDLTKAYDQLERLFDQEARVRQAALNRRRDLEKTVTRTEDEIARLLGSEGPSRADLVSRRQRDVALASGGLGGEADPAQSAASLLARKNLLLQQRRQLTAQIDASSAIGKGAVQQREERSGINEEINKLTDGLKELKDAMGRELANSIKELQRTIQQQIQAESGIETLADAAAAVARGEMSMFDVEKQFGPVLRGAEKLQAAGVTGVSELSFDEAGAIVKALRNKDPLVFGQLRAIAEREADRRLAETGERGDVGVILQQLRNELSRQRGGIAADFFGLSGPNPYERAADRLVGEADPAKVAAARARVEEELEAQRRVNMEYDAAQRNESGKFLFKAGQEFGMAVQGFRAAVGQFEINVMAMPVFPAGGAPAAAGGLARGGIVYASKGVGPVPAPAAAGDIGGAIVSQLMQPKGTDTVPAMLTPGEFVMRKSSVDSIGRENLERMNKTGIMHAAKGGLVRYLQGGAFVDPDDEAALPIGLAGVRRPGEGYFEPDKYMKEHGHPGRVGGMLSRGSDSRQAQNLVDQFKTWAGGGTEPGLGVEDPERVIRWYKRRNKEDEKKANIIALDLAAQKKTPVGPGADIIQELKEEELNAQRSPGLQTMTPEQMRKHYGIAPARQRTPGEKAAREQQQQQTDDTVAAIRAPVGVGPGFLSAVTGPTELTDKQQRAKGLLPPVPPLYTDGKLTAAMGPTHPRLAARQQELAETAGLPKEEYDKRLAAGNAKRAKRDKARAAKGQAAAKARQIKALAAVNRRRAKRGLPPLTQADRDKAKTQLKKRRADRVAEQKKADQAAADAARASRPKSIAQLSRERRLRDVESIELRSDQEGALLQHRAIAKLADPQQRYDAQGIMNRIKSSLSTLGVDNFDLLSGQRDREGVSPDKIKSPELMADLLYGRHTKGAFGKEGVFPFLSSAIEARKSRDLDRSAKAAIARVAKQKKDEADHKAYMQKIEDDAAASTRRYEAATARGKQKFGTDRPAIQKRVELAARRDVYDSRSTRRPKRGANKPGVPDLAYPRLLHEFRNRSVEAFKTDVYFDNYPEDLVDLQGWYDRGYDVATTNWDTDKMADMAGKRELQRERKAFNDLELKRVSRGAVSSEKGEYAAGYYMQHEVQRLGRKKIYLERKIQQNIFDQTDVLKALGLGEGLSTVAVGRSLDVLGGVGMKTEKKGYTEFEAQKGAPVKTFTAEQLKKVDDYQAEKQKNLKWQKDAKRKLDQARIALQEMQRQEAAGDKRPRAIAMVQSQIAAAEEDLNAAMRAGESLGSYRHREAASLVGRTEGTTQWNIQRLRDPRDAQNYIKALKTEDQELSRRGWVDQLLKGAMGAGPEGKEGYDAGWLDWSAKNVPKAMGNLFGKVKAAARPIQESLVVGGGYLEKMVLAGAQMAGATGMSQMEYDSMMQSLDESIAASLTELEGMPQDFKSYLSAEWERIKHTHRTTTWTGGKKTGAPTELPEDVLNFGSTVLRSGVDILFGDRETGPQAGVDQRSGAMDAVRKRRDYEFTSREAALMGGGSRQVATGTLTEEQLSDPSFGAPVVGVDRKDPLGLWLKGEGVLGDAFEAMGLRDPTEGGIDPFGGTDTAEGDPVLRRIAMEAELNRLRSQQALGDAAITATQIASEEAGVSLLMGGAGAVKLPGKGYGKIREVLKRPQGGGPGTGVGGIGPARRPMDRLFRTKPAEVKMPSGPQPGPSRPLVQKPLAVREVPRPGAQTSVRRPGGVKQPTKSAATLEAEAAAEIDMLAGEAGAAARQEGAAMRSRGQQVGDTRSVTAAVDDVVPVPGAGAIPASESTIFGMPVGDLSSLNPKNWWKSVKSVTQSPLGRSKIAGSVGFATGAYLNPMAPLTSGLIGEAVGMGAWRLGEAAFKKLMQAVTKGGKGAKGQSSTVQRVVEAAKKKVTGSKTGSAAAIETEQEISAAVRAQELSQQSKVTGAVDDGPIPTSLRARRGVPEPEIPTAEFAAPELGAPKLRVGEGAPKPSPRVDAAAEAAKRTSVQTGPQAGPHIRAQLKLQGAGDDLLQTQQGTVGVGEQTSVNISRQPAARRPVPVEEPLATFTPEVGATGPFSPDLQTVTATRRVSFPSREVASRTQTAAQTADVVDISSIVNKPLPANAMDQIRGPLRTGGRPMHQTIVEGAKGGSRPGLAKSRAVKAQAQKTTDLQLQANRQLVKSQRTAKIQRINTAEQATQDLRIAQRAEEAKAYNRAVQRRLKQEAEDLQRVQAFEEAEAQAELARLGLADKADIPVRSTVEAVHPSVVEKQMSEMFRKRAAGQAQIDKFRRHQAAKIPKRTRATAEPVGTEPIYGPEGPHGGGPLRDIKSEMSPIVTGQPPQIIGKGGSITVGPADIRKLTLPDRLGGQAMVPSHLDLPRVPTPPGVARSASMRAGRPGPRTVTPELPDVRTPIRMRLDEQALLRQEQGAAQIAKFNKHKAAQMQRRARTTAEPVGADDPGFARQGGGPPRSIQSELAPFDLPPAMRAHPHASPAHPGPPATPSAAYTKYTTPQGARQPMGPLLSEAALEGEGLGTIKQMHQFLKNNNFFKGQNVSRLPKADLQNFIRDNWDDIMGGQLYQKGGMVDQDLPVGIRNPKLAPLRAAGHLLNWMFSESDEEKTERLGLGHSGGFGGFGAPRPAKARGSMGGRTAKGRAKGFGMYNRGGFVPGYQGGGNVDSIPAYLTAGEYVMQRESVQKYGDKFMDDVNRLKFNGGGRTGPPVGGTSSNVGQANDLERGAQLAADSIIGAFTKGAQMVGDAIRAALAPENLAAQLGGVVGQKMKESIAATSIEMKGNMGVDVRLSGNGATGDQAKKTQSTIKNAIASAFNSRTNVDGSSKDPSISQPNSGA